MVGFHFLKGAKSTFLNKLFGLRGLLNRVRFQSNEWNSKWLKSGVRVHKTAIVDIGARIGAGSVIWHFTHIRSSAVIGDECTIGQGCYVDASVEIGNKCKIANGVNIYQGVKIEDGVFIGPNTTFTNDLWPRAIDEFSNKIVLKDYAKTLVENGASIGAGCVILPVTIGAFAMIAAGTTVINDVLPSNRFRRKVVEDSVLKK